MIDIIVPTHHVPLMKTLKLTIGCIDALYANTDEPFNLIITDDSTDELTPAYFKELQKEHNNVTIIHSDKPYKTGNQFINQGLAKATNEFVGLVSNSVTVEPDWLGVALDFIKQDPKVAVVGFKCLYPWGLIETAGIYMDGVIPKDLGRDKPAQALTSVFNVEACSWSFVLLRKSAIGTLDENTYHGFAGWDDIDNCFTLRKAGWKIVTCGLGSGYHLPRSTRTGSDPAKKQKQSEENGRIFYKKWGYWGTIQKARQQAIELMK